MICSTPSDLNGGDQEGQQGGGGGEGLSPEELANSCMPGTDGAMGT